jgi:VRR-NUC domain
MNYPFHVDAPAVADAGSEIDIQARFRARLRTLAPRVRCAAVPNAGKRTGWAAQQAKKEGLASGYPDLIVTWSNSGIPGVAWLEFKAKAGDVSEAQFDWLMHLHNCGHHVGVFRSVETALAFVRNAGAPFPYDPVQVAA